MESRGEYLSLLMKLVNRDRLWRTFEECKLIYCSYGSLNSVKGITCIEGVIFCGLRDYPDNHDLQDGFFFIKDKFENRAYVLEHLPTIQTANGLNLERN